MKTKYLRVILVITFFTAIGTSVSAQVTENAHEQELVNPSLTEDQQKLIDSLKEYGETDLLKIKERYTYKLRTNPEEGDQFVLDRINRQIKLVRGAKID
jgi:activator of 2-hydroxyglutaryl-CoA dehydratase